MFLETSAVTGENVEEAFLKCSRSILTKIEAGNFNTFSRFGHHNNISMKSIHNVQGGGSNPSFKIYFPLLDNYLFPIFSQTPQFSYLFPKWIQSFYSIRVSYFMKYMGLLPRHYNYHSTLFQRKMQVYMQVNPPSNSTLFYVPLFFAKNPPLERGICNM